MPENKLPHSPKYGGKFGHKVFYLILRWFGPGPAYLLLVFVTSYYVFILKRPRKMASHYLKKRFPQDGHLKRLFKTYRYIYNFGLCLVDQAAMGILGRERFSIDFPNREELYRLSKRNKGMVLLTSHVGNWQTGMAVIDDMAKPVNFILRLEEHEVDRFFFNLSKNNKKIKIIDPTSFLGGLVEATQRLQRGECISIMGDRSWGARTESAVFLGAPALFPVTPYHLVISNEADLVILLTARTGKLAFRIDYTYFSFADLNNIGKTKSECREGLLKKYIETIEGYVNQYPYMWFNFFDFWKTDKQEFEAETL